VEIISFTFCHPERSGLIREANKPAESKDPYSLDRKPLLERSTYHAAGT